MQPVPNMIGQARGGYSNQVFASNQTCIINYMIAYFRVPSIDPHEIMIIYDHYHPASFESSLFMRQQEDTLIISWPAADWGYEPSDQGLPYLKAILLSSFRGRSAREWQVNTSNVTHRRFQILRKKNVPSCSFPPNDEVVASPWNLDAGAGEVDPEEGESLIWVRWESCAHERKVVTHGSE